MLPLTTPDVPKDYIAHLLAAGHIILTHFIYRLALLYSESFLCQSCYDFHYMYSFSPFIHHFTIFVGITHTHHNSQYSIDTINCTNSQVVYTEGPCTWLQAVMALLLVSFLSLHMINFLHTMRGSVPAIFASCNPQLLL